MPIAAVCPHCDSQFQLQPDLLGRSIRCPNNDCREIFVVRDRDADRVDPMVSPANTVASEPAKKELPYERIEADPSPLIPIVEGEVAESVPSTVGLPVAPQVFDAEHLAPSKNVSGRSHSPEADAASAGDHSPGETIAQMKSRRMGSESAGADVPKQVAWTPEANLPPAIAAKPRPKTARVLDEDDGDVDELLLRRRGSGRNYWAYVLVGVIIAILGIGGATGIRLIYQQIHLERNLADEAFDEFKKQNYPKASELYSELLTQFATSADADRYQFFSDLSDTHIAAGAITVREDPTPALEKFQGFLSTHANDPLSKPDDTGFGYDIFQAGNKLVDGMIENVRDRLARYRSDRKKLVELSAAEAAIDAGRKLIPTVEKYRLRDKEIKGLESQRKSLDDLQGECLRERQRLAVIDPYRDLVEDPTEERIAEFESELVRTGFRQDSEAMTLVDSAKTRLRGLVRFIRDVRPPAVAPADRSPGLLFVSVPAGRVTPPLVPSAAEVIPETFFALARGILYTFDSESGSLLWALRVGRAATDIPVRLPLGDGINELALIPTDSDEGPGLVARNVRSGQLNWYQPLEAPIAGRPVILGNRIYLPLRDDAGTVVEIEARSGTRLGFLQIRQRVGPGAVAMPGSSLLFLAAEARRVFVLDAAPYDSEGNRLPMRCTHVLATGHRELALRVPPTIVGAPLNAGAGSTRFLLLAIAEQTLSTQLASYSLPTLDATKAAADAVPPEIPLTPTASVSVPGQIWFPIVDVGERVAIVTDAGAFALLGTSQPGNQDAGLYKIPSVSLPTDPRHPIIGQIVTADEDSYWILARGRLLRLRLAFNSQLGLSMTLVGTPLPGGLPVQSPQTNAKRDTVFSVVRSEDSDGIRALAWDPHSGRVKWDRKLGAVLPSAPKLLGDQVLLVDEDGGVHRLPANAGQSAVPEEKSLIAESNWTIAPPVLAATDPARVAISADGKLAWVLVPDLNEKEAQVLRVRMVDSNSVKETIVPLPERLAGQALAVGTGVVMPLADGFFYRFDPGASKLLQGPMWRGEQAGRDASCYLSRVDINEFLSSDGAKTIRRWRWSSAESEWKSIGAKCELREKVAFAPRMVALGENTRRLFVADVVNSVWMFDGDNPVEPLRRWRGSAEGTIPVGKPGLGFLASTGLDGSPRIIYGVDGKHLVCITPGADNPIWVAMRLNQDDFLGAFVDATRAILTDLSGHITVLNLETGERLNPPFRAEGEALPRTQAVPIGGNRLLLPLTDGSAVFLPYPGI